MFETELVGVSPSGKAPGFDLGIPRFESLYPSHFFSVSKLIGVSPSGKAPGFDLGIPRFESLYPSHWQCSSAG